MVESPSRFQSQAGLAPGVPNLATTIGTDGDARVALTGGMATVADDRKEPRTPGAAQRFADRAGGPTLFEGTGYQTGVALLHAMVLLSRRLGSPLVVLRLRCESRTLVDGGGQLGYDLGLLTPEVDLQIEAKGSPVLSDIVELLERLTSLGGHPRKRLQLVHGKVNAWTTALALLVRNAGEALDDDDLSKIVAASQDAERLELLTAVTVPPDGGSVKSLLAGMAPPEALTPEALAREVRRHAHFLAGERAEDLIERLSVRLTEAFRTRATLVIAELHDELLAAGLVPQVGAVTPMTDQLLARAIGTLDLCPAPLPEPVLAAALGLTAGGVFVLLREFIDAGLVVADDEGLWRPRSDAITRAALGTAPRDVLAQLVESPSASKQQLMAQVPNVLALCEATIRDDPFLVTRAFHPYDKAAKSTGDLSTVYLLARTVLEAAAHVPTGSPERDKRVLWLRAHARICGTSWTLQRVGQENDAAAEMDAARRESVTYHDDDNLAFVDKCQGRLSRLRAERATAQGDAQTAKRLYAESRARLDTAYVAFQRLLEDLRYVDRNYTEEPGECLALRARTELSAGDVDAAEEFVARAHNELDGLGPRCKPWADASLVDAEIALARVRDGVSAANARELLGREQNRLAGVLAEFQPDADDSTLVDVAANEIVARTLQVLGTLALELGDTPLAARLLEQAGDHFQRVGQLRAGYRCQAHALDLTDGIPEALLAALQAADSDDGGRVEAVRLHAAEPLSAAPERHWQALVQRGQLTAAAREHRWTDKMAV
jgi:tetratricopeptide (TPR) repeat protein